MTVEKLGNKEVLDEIEKGRIWKAKELLRQKIRHSEYNETLFSAYADVLSIMRDDLEAGKYYFLAGLRSEDRKKKIDLLNDAISAIEICLKITKIDIKENAPLPEFVYGRFGDFYYKFGELYYHIYSHTKEKNHLNRTIDIYNDTINFTRKTDFQKIG